MTTVNEFNLRRLFPSSQRRGGRASLIEAGAPGAKREPDRAKPQLMVSSAKLFRPEDFAELTTVTASRYRARASRPSAALSVASQFLLDAAASPPLRGGEYSLRASVHESGDASIVARLRSLLERLPADIPAELRSVGSFAAGCPRAQHDRDNTTPAPRCSRVH